jgi:hypothetical protein
MAAKDFADKEVVDAYVYLLGRYLVLRQEHVDLAEEGVDYNVIKYNPVGSADFVNPNLDVAYLEAWIAVDAETPAILTVPDIAGRYYTAQILDEWGEVIANINERNFPDHPHGRFAFIAPGSTPDLPDDVVSVELRSNKAKMLARVELKDDWDGAVDLQRQFTLASMGNPEIEPPVVAPVFDNVTLIGAEIFQRVDDVLSSAVDVCPAAEQQAEMAGKIGAYIAASPDGSAEIAAIVRDQAVPTFLEHAVTKAGAFQNNWLGTLTIGNYGDEYWTRTAANLVGIWANASAEVIYFVCTRDADGNLLDGSRDYRMTFPKDARPDAVVNAYWSIILVSLPDYRVVPNPGNRFNLNSYSPLVEGDDGSLQLDFSPELRDESRAANWLPTPEGAPFSLTLRTYVPKEVVTSGNWFPVPVQVSAND